MGWCSQPTCEVILDNVKVSRDNMLGQRGMGFKYAMEGLDGGRVNIGACSLGGAQFAFDKVARSVLYYPIPAECCFQYHM